ncbi:MAG: DHH family phosphoesterase [Planctomycetes bacterium]|nr:DHH family phosphoesterase [Planctomycetota bacterium]
MAKRWRIYPHDPDLIDSLERASGISSVIAQLLICRGIVDPKVAREFLEAKLSGLHDPETLPGAAEAAQQIIQAIRANRRIVIYGDYDVDGMSGTALLLRCLKMLGADVGYYVPNRLDEGYGLNDDALRTLAERETHLVVSVDCGITSAGEAQTARKLGLELIITDHHEMADSLPEADVIVHPRLPGSNYPFGELCGAGVALKLAWALCQQASDSKKVGQRMKDFLMQSVGLAALGTVADVVPLVDENRLIVRHGLTSLRPQPTPRIAELMKITELDQKPQLSSEDIAFTLAPRMNAAGRLGQAQLGVELLTTDDPKRAQSLAEIAQDIARNKAAAFLHNRGQHRLDYHAGQFGHQHAAVGTRADVVQSNLVDRHIQLR